MPNKVSDNKKIAKNSILLYVRMAIVLVVSLYTTRIVLNVLGVEDYGIYNVVCGFVSLFSFLNGTLANSVNRYFNIEIGRKEVSRVNDVFNCAVRIQVGLAIFIFFIVEIIGGWFINSKMVIPEDRILIANLVFQFSLISLVNTILQTPFIAAVLAYERMNFYAVVSIIDVFSKLLVAISLKFISYDKLCLYGLFLMSISIMDFLLYYFYSKINFRDLRYCKLNNRKMFKSMLSFSGWFLLNPLAYTGRSQGGALVLNYYFGPVINAAYAIANQVASAIDSFSMNVSVAARPQLIQSYSSGDYNRSAGLFFSTSKFMFVTILILFLPLLFNMDFILHLWLGENIPQYTFEFCSIILFVKLIDSLNPSCTNLILATGKIKIYMIVSSLLIISVVPFSIIAFHNNCSPILLFIIMSFCTLINQITSFLVLHRSFNAICIREYFDICLRLFLLLIVSIGCVGLINYLLKLNPFLQLVVDTVFSCFLVFSISFFAVLNKSERDYLNKLVVGFLKKK